MSTLHPSQVEIFRLWQIYLDNVNPLLKVTHTPTLQARIIDAAADVGNIPPTLEALMFSIYCLAILSLSEEECRTLFQSSRDDLLNGYQFACQQALLNCEVLRTSDRDCLAALYLYLVSTSRTEAAEPGKRLTLPRSLLDLKQILALCRQSWASPSVSHCAWVSIPSPATADVLF